MFNTIFTENFCKKWVFKQKLMLIFPDFRKNHPCGDSLVTRIWRKYWPSNVLTRQNIVTLLNRKRGVTGNTKYAYLKGPYYVCSTMNWMNNSSTLSLTSFNYFFCSSLFYAVFPRWTSKE